MIKSGQGFLKIEKIFSVEHGAEASARLYSLIETAKANKLKIYEYLEWVFENIHILRADELVSWSAKIPNNIRTS